MSSPNPIYIDDDGTFTNYNNNNVDIYTPNVTSNGNDISNSNNSNSNNIQDIYNELVKVIENDHRGEALIKRINDNDIDINKIISVSGENLLHYCCKKNIPKVVVLLIKAGINVESLDYNNNTPLMICAIKGSHCIMKLLLDREVSINNKNAEGITALEFAASEGKKECVKLLIEYGANVRNSEALVLASEHGYLDVVRLLLEKGADSSSKESLIRAVRGGNSLVVKQLLQDKTTPEEAITVCAEYDEETCMRVLLDHLDSDNMHRGVVLHEVVKNSKGLTRLKCLNLLLENNDINIDYCYDYHSCSNVTPLMVAIDIWNVHAIKLLLNSGANVNALNSRLQSALVYGILYHYYYHYHYHYY